jgi:hypothetical protein
VPRLLKISNKIDHVATVQRQMNESLELFSKFYFLKYAYINSHSVGEKLRQFNGFRLSPGLVLMGISLKEATTLLSRLTKEIQDERRFIKQA